MTSLLFISFCTFKGNTKLDLTPTVLILLIAKVKAYMELFKYSIYSSPSRNLCTAEIRSSYYRKGFQYVLLDRPKLCFKSRKN
jgi:hypothetical protein